MTGLSDAALARLNLEIEFSVSPENELSPPPGGDSGVPWVYVTRTGESLVAYISRDLDSALKKRLRELGARRLFDDPDAVTHAAEVEGTPSASALEQSSICEGRVLERKPAHSEYADVIERDGAYVVLRGCQVVARAWTVRGDSRASEIAVETDEDCRRQGLARQVASAWAAATIVQGRVAFYSFRRENAASRALADSLETRSYGIAVGYAPKKG